MSEKEKKKPRRLKDCSVSYDAYTIYVEDLTDIKSKEILEELASTIGKMTNWNDIFATVVKERLLSFEEALDLMHFTHTINSVYEAPHRELLEGGFDLEQAMTVINKFFSKVHAQVVHEAQNIEPESDGDSD